MKILITIIIFFISISSLYSQQDDSLSNRGHTYTPLSMLFSDFNKDNNKLYSDSSSVKWIPVKQKTSFLNDCIYIFGTAAIAAVIYLLWPEDNPVPNKKLTFGTPPPPR